MRILSALTAPALCSADTYSEGIFEHPLQNGGRLVEFKFEITSQYNGSQLLEIFPQPLASVLGPFRGDLDSLKGFLVRGRWKERVWGAAPIEVAPYGSSMHVKASKSSKRVSSSLWTRAAWMFSSVLGASFQSLDPELKSFYWIAPLDISGATGPVRVNSNPNEHVCTENLERFTDLLPCRHRRGLGESILRLSREMARTEFLQISVEAANTSSELLVLKGSVIAVLTDSADLTLSQCPAVSQTLEQVAKTPQQVHVKRSLIGTAKRPERTAGKLLVSITNRDSQKSHFIEYYEQLPFFLVPLWSTHSTVSSMNGHSKGGLPSITYSDGLTSPTFFKYSFPLAPNETVTIALDVYKKYVSVDKLSYSFEKGFDIASAAFRIDREASVHLTRGLVVVIPLADQTSTFNSIAITLTTISIFFGMIYRNFSGKRRDIVSQDDAAVAAREPPIVRLIRFLISRIRQSSPS